MTEEEMKKKVREDDKKLVINKIKNLEQQILKSGHMIGTIPLKELRNQTREELLIRATQLEDILNEVEPSEISQELEKLKRTQQENREKIGRLLSELRTEELINPTQDLSLEENRRLEQQMRHSRIRQRLQIIGLESERIREGMIHRQDINRYDEELERKTDIDYDIVLPEYLGISEADLQTIQEDTVRQWDDETEMNEFWRIQDSIAQQDINIFEADRDFENNNTQWMRETEDSKHEPRLETGEREIDIDQLLDEIEHSRHPQDHHTVPTSTRGVSTIQPRDILEDLDLDGDHKISSSELNHSKGTAPYTNLTQLHPNILRGIERSIKIQRRGIDLEDASKLTDNINLVQQSVGNYDAYKNLFNVRFV